MLILFTASGCQQNTVSTLIGRWEGRPDTAAAREGREKEKYGATQNDEASDHMTTDTVQATDWEQYDLLVHFDFQSAERVEMSLDGNGNTQIGSWRIVESTPADCTIEVKIIQPAEQTSEEVASDGVASESEPRRFKLELDEREGECVGFLLSEVGADQQLGALYFRRVVPVQ